LVTARRHAGPLAAALALAVTACGGPPPRPAPPPANVDAPPSSSPPGVASAAPPEPPELPDAPPTGDTELFGRACARDTLEPRLAAAVEAMQARANTLGVRLICVRGEGPGPHRNGRAVDLRFATHAGYGGGRGGCPKGRETTVCRADEDRETWEAIFGAIRDTREVRWLAWEYWARDTGVIREDGSYPRGRYSAAKRHAIRAQKWRREIGHFELR
jgi:hypothetical protein